MSVLIKGMEMPKDCLSCPCMVSDCEGDMCAFQSYEKNATFEDWEQMKASCPLIELPPHGRLIDADALEELFREVIGNIFKREEIKPVLEHMVRASAMVVEMVKDSPTIIEAEVEK